MALLDRVHTAILAAGEKGAQHATRTLRHEAVSAGWPVEAARCIEVKHHEGHLKATCEGAEDYEYGLESRPPNSMTRRFHARVDHYADAVVEGELVRHLGDLL